MRSLIVLLSLLIAAAVSSCDRNQEFVFLPPDEVGPDPFSPDVAIPVPEEWAELADEIEQVAGKLLDEDR